MNGDRDYPAASKEGGKVYIVNEAIDAHADHPVVVSSEPVHHEDDFTTDFSKVRKPCNWYFRVNAGKISEFFHCKHPFLTYKIICLGLPW